MRVSTMWCLVVLGCVLCLSGCGGSNGGIADAVVDGSWSISLSDTPPAGPPAPMTGSAAYSTIPPPPASFGVTITVDGQTFASIDSFGNITNVTGYINGNTIHITFDTDYFGGTTTVTIDGQVTSSTSMSGTYTCTGFLTHNGYWTATLNP